ncbi:hypothetical protein I8752_16360 [Nostocaceae cyanobacterium CENA369]|uniref:Uncharacterized protein n=1 Tax=Dendronalium phyllosphericum CENA369 TaxID=1725256 RepID=A0A8J7I625_9NOST|nr:hypothetical protein [Dendronalium phyllosphericum]MBH8574568.1 hypothetical protein [Dendronalium phyllosphericum CENA369]
MSEDNVFQPDPEWDYYEIWESLHSVKSKIEAGLTFLAKQELADNSTDEKLVEILDPALSELGRLVEDELSDSIDYEDE